jgi:iron complex outermembrane receptor protein
VGEAGYPTTYPSRSADASSPKAALVFQPFEVTTLRSSIGRSFRPPSIYELYSVFIYRGVTTMSGPDLAPEYTTSWDAGIEQRLWPGAKFTATYFENYMEDLIYSKTQTETLVERVNVGEAESKGVELEIEQRFENSRIFANFTYTDSQVTENDADPSLVGKDLVQVPQKMFNIGGDYRYGPFTTSIIGRYVSKRYRYDDNRDEAEGVYTSYDPYFVTDARIGYKITSFAEFSLSVDNIFNEDYYSYYKAPERSWFAELSFTY